MYEREIELEPAEARKYSDCLERVEAAGKDGAAGFAQNGCFSIPGGINNHESDELREKALCWMGYHQSNNNLETWG